MNDHPLGRASLAKSQNTRVFDVLLLGPWLAWLATRRQLSDLERAGLLAVGLGVIAYNGRNWLRINAALACPPSKPNGL